MDREVEAFFGRMEQLFETQDVSGILELFTSPLPVYSENGITLHSDRSDTELSIRRLLFEARVVGVRHLRRRILSVKPSSLGHGTMYHLEWLYLGRNGTVITTSEAKYFCGREADGELRIFMIEYVKSAFPEALSGMPRAPEVHARLN